MHLLFDLDEDSTVLRKTARPLLPPNPEAKAYRSLKVFNAGHAPSRLA